MKIFANKRTYRGTQVYNEPMKEKKKDKTLLEKVKDIDWTIPLIALTCLIISGIVWYIWSVEFCGAVFFGLISVIIFLLFTSGGASLSDFLEKKLGKNLGSNLGCLVMLLGPILAGTLFASSIDYWDHKKYYQDREVGVYITPYGECYHKYYDCYTIKGHKIKSVSKSKAINMGRRPCEICTP